MSKSLINILPDHASNKKDWPWKVETEASIYDETTSWPKISVITPSFNQGNFIEETARSVILQNYPNFEYFIVDGGSTDNTINIIKKYEKYVTKWVSEKDEGQSDALNKAFNWCTGDLICWINSDDYFYPGAFLKIAEKYLTCNKTETSIITGNTISIDKESNSLANSTKSYFPFNTPADLTLINHSKWYLPQPSSFFLRAKIIQTGFFLRKDLHYQMDRDIIYRLLKIGKLVLIDEDIATYRVHEESKTTGGKHVFDSTFETIKTFAFYRSGIPREDKIRRRVMHLRMAPGCLSLARNSNQLFQSIKYYIMAAYYRPAFLKTKKYWYSVIKSILRRG